MVRYVNAEELAEMTGLSVSSINNYKDGWRFAKFRKGHLLRFDNEFIDVFLDFLWLRRNNTAIQKFKRFITPSAYGNTK